MTKNFFWLGIKMKEKTMTGPKYIYSINENLPVYYCKYCNLIGYATRYLLNNSTKSTGCLWGDVQEAQPSSQSLVDNEDELSNYFSIYQLVGQNIISKESNNLVPRALSLLPPRPGDKALSTRLRIELKPR